MGVAMAEVKEGTWQPRLRTVHTHCDPQLRSRSRLSVTSWGADAIPTCDSRGTVLCKGLRLGGGRTFGGIFKGNPCH